MIDTDLKSLAEQPADRALDRLEVDIWSGVTRHERAHRPIRRILMLQAMVLIVALVGSLVAGEHQARSAQASNFDVFSPHMPLSVSTLLLGGAP